MKRTHNDDNLFLCGLKRDADYKALASFVSHDPVILVESEEVSVRILPTRSNGSPTVPLVDTFGPKGLSSAEHKQRDGLESDCFFRHQSYAPIHVGDLIMGS